METDRISQAIAAVVAIAAPPPPGTLSAEKIEQLLDRIKTHKAEIEAVTMTLRLRGVAESDFATAAATLTPDDVAPMMNTLAFMDAHAL